MSVAALPSDAPVTAAVTRADKKLAKSGDEPASDFKTLVKGEAGRDAGHADRNERAGSEGGEVEGDRDDRTGWRRWSGTLFDRHAGKLHGDTGEPGQEIDGEKASGEGEAGEPDGTAGIMITAIAGKETAGKLNNQAANGQIAAEKMGADGAAVATMAKGAETTAEAKSATPGSRPGEATMTIGHKSEGTAQFVRLAGAEQAQGGSQSSSANEIVLPRGDAGNGPASDGEGETGEGRNRDQQASRSGQSQNGNRISGVSVISQQMTPAMPVQPAGMTGTAFAASLAEGLTRTERPEMAGQVMLNQAVSKPGPVTTLSIQLQPAELGTVTARISGTEAQLSIEITVDNAEARHRLSSDSDAIVTALRGLGVDVDRISIQQSQANSAATPNNATGRENEFAQQEGGRGEQQGEASRQGFGRGQGDEARGGQGNAQSQNPGGGVYI